MRYPVGPVYQSVVVDRPAAQRSAQLSWSEVHGDTIIIPPERMKAKDGTAVDHLVPITSAIQEVIAVAAALSGREVPVLAIKAGKPP